MHPDKTALERAFEMAEAGSVATVEEIRRALRDEGYGTHEVTGSSLLGQLRALIRAAKERRAD